MPDYTQYECGDEITKNGYGIVFHPNLPWITCEKQAIFILVFYK